MAYTLCPGIFFCEASGRLVFLDLPRDRYFSLENAAERRIRQTVLTGSTEPEDIVLEGLVRQGILDRTERPSAPSAPPLLPDPSDSMLDWTGSARPHLLQVLCAGAAVVRARSALRRKGMAASLEAVRWRRPNTAPSSNAMDAIGRIAGAFARADLYLSPLDQCLPRSLALAGALARRRLPAHLVIGVRLRPFLAHSWVQTDGMVLNDRPDVVRTFVPILVI